MKRIESDAETAFPVYDEQTAPEPSRETLRRAKAKYGFIPNLLGELAESPSAVKAYSHLQDLLAEGRFTPGERQVLFLTVSAANSCEYCVAAHSAGAKMEHVPDEVVAGIRNGTPLPDAARGAAPVHAGDRRRARMDRFRASG
jgi:AhpD family alkylhydroperoxidase